jgi:hypothetical protein
MPHYQTNPPPLPRPFTCHASRVTRHV